MEMTQNENMYIFIEPKSRKILDSAIYCNKVNEFVYLSTYLKYYIFPTSEHWALNQIPLIGLIKILDLESTSNHCSFESHGQIGSMFKVIINRMISLGYLRLTEPHEEIGHEYGLI